MLRKYAGESIKVDALFADALKVLKEAGAEIVDPVEVTTLGKFEDQEFQVLLYEFKADLAAYFQWFGPTSPLKSFGRRNRFQ